MPSPFPGMDPWLEGPGIFPDLHNTLIIELKRVLNACLPAPYFATAANRVWIDDSQNREPDVAVFKEPDFSPGAASGGVALLDAAGMMVLEDPDWIDPFEEPYLEIRSSIEERLVTAIEILSPSNKQEGAGRNSYRQKQAEMRAGSVNFVEIDLLRGGMHTTLISRQSLRANFRAYDYHICILPANLPGRILVTAFRMQDKIPRIGIPYDAAEPTIPIDLQALVYKSYADSKYERRIDYAKPCIPKLSTEQQLWADEILKSKGTAT